MSIHRIEPNIYACTLCTKEFPSKSSLRDHKMGHKMQVIESKLACNICQKFYPRRNLRNHIRSHETKRVSCNICNKVLATEQNLQMHKVQNQTKEPLACRTPVGPYNWPLNPIQCPGLTTFTFVLIDLQGGRSCAVARVAPAKKFGLGRKF